MIWRIAGILIFLIAFALGIVAFVSYIALCLLLPGAIVGSIVLATEFVSTHVLWSIPAFLIGCFIYSFKRKLPEENPKPRESCGEPYR